MSVPIPDRVSSSVRESDIPLILGLADGTHFKVIAAENNMTESQVGNRVYWLRSRVFKARTNAQVVAMAYHYGILHSPSENTSVSGM